MEMAPGPVLDVLKERASQSRDAARDDPIDEDVEKALRGRGDPLIDLALARYGRHMDVVSGLFQSAAPGSAVRLACLSNRALRHDSFLYFPVGLLGREPGPMADWLLSASNNELSALFENPSLNDSFLRDLLERGKGWESIDDDKLCRCVSVLSRNPRMWTPREDDWMDGYDEYSYGAVFNAAWMLAETAPTTRPWAASLGSLFERLQPDGFSVKEPLAVAARWRVDPDDAEAIESEAKGHVRGYLGINEQVRKGLARLALHGSGKLLAELLSSNDVAFRAAAYAAGDLDADQLRAGYERDKDLAFNEAISNLYLWRNQPTRRVLRDIAWDVVRNDKHSDLMAANQFNWMEKDMRGKHPAWFTDEEEREDSGDEEVDDQAPATKADLSAIAGHIERQSLGLDAISQGLRDLMSRTGWIWWFSLGALVASLLHS